HIGAPLPPIRLRQRMGSPGDACGGPAVRGAIALVGQPILVRERGPGRAAQDRGHLVSRGAPSGGPEARWRSAAVEFPARGCWELTGQYGGQELRFVVLVGP